MSQVHEFNHPLISHKLTLMRDKRTSTKDFRQLLTEISMLMGFEVTRDLETKMIPVETPVCGGEFPILAEEHFAIVPILRAGLGMVEGLQTLLPFAHVGHLGMYRDHDTHEPVSYYAKIPANAEERICLIVDPMLATGGSLTAAIQYLRERGVKDIRALTLVSCPEGVKTVLDYDPDVRLYTCSVDRELNANAYILPGLGDAGDRIYGTK